MHLHNFIIAKTTNLENGFSLQHHECRCGEDSFVLVSPNHEGIEEDYFIGNTAKEMLQNKYDGLLEEMKRNATRLRHIKKMMGQL